MGKILDGKNLAKLNSQILKEEVNDLRNKSIVPFFCVINLGDDPSSQIYIRSKKKLADEIGIKQKTFQLPATTKQADLVKLIKRLNVNEQVSGIMIQLPVPKQINLNEVLATIDPQKDVDCLTPSNVGRLWQTNHFVEPATASGIMNLLTHYGIGLRGKKVVIIGRSSIVGKPLAALMLEQDATVSILHSKTKNIADYTLKADVIVSTTGTPKLITASIIKKNAVIIDAGINRLANGHLVGDVDFTGVHEKASFITPVPGGVGPLTVEALMEQVVKIARRRNDR